MITGRNKAGFTLVELLAVIAIIAVTAGLLFPVFTQAKTKARVVKVHVELKQVADAVQMYCDDWRGSPPYASESCQAVSIRDYYELPEPLYRYMGTKRFLDPFNPGRTYKYIAPGLGYINNSVAKITLYIPADYPISNQDCLPYRSQRDSPIKWVVWSVGPSGGCDLFQFHQNLMPVRKGCWYPYDKKGLIVRLSDGRKSP